MFVHPAAQILFVILDKTPTPLTPPSHPHGKIQGIVVREQKLITKKATWDTPPVLKEIDEPPTFKKQEPDVVMWCQKGLL